LSLLAIPALVAGIAGCGEDGAGDQTVATPPPESETETGGTDTGETGTGETGSGETEPEAAPSGSEGSGDAVEIVEFKYEPEALTVPAGTTVTFTNQDAAPHTATADDDSFDTGSLAKDDSAEETFDEPGTYSYFCRFHVFMKGSVVVE
jgi:plastocyanin